MMDAYFSNYKKQGIRTILNLPSIWVQWWAWNTIMHDLFGLPAIDYWFQALALSILVASIGSRYRYITLDKP